MVGKRETETLTPAIKATKGVAYLERFVSIVATVSIVDLHDLCDETRGRKEAPGTEIARKLCR